MIYWTLNELAAKTNKKPFGGVSGAMLTIGENVMAGCGDDYWLITDTDDEAAVEAAWESKIKKIDAYASGISDMVNKRIQAANEAAAARIETKTKFNDTPDTVGDYATDEHTSTISTSEQTGFLSSGEKANLAGLYGIMQDVATDIQRKFIIPEEFI